MKKVMDTLCCLLGLIVLMGIGCMLILLLMLKLIYLVIFSIIDFITGKNLIFIY